MKKDNTALLQCREVFHLEFLRWMGRKIKPKHYALKGGANLRFFFHSLRYSEDMDLDICGVRVDVLKEIIMGILEARAFQDTLKPFGVERIGAPNISKAKQTETTQRFKAHLFTVSGEDIFTKIKFSRRGLKESVVVEPVSDIIMRAYKMPPLLVSHYAVDAAIAQKIQALAMRSTIQARDVFDLYMLSSQYQGQKPFSMPEIGAAILAKANGRIFKISFEHFRDSVVSYLTYEDQSVYGAPDSWDEIKLKASHLIEELSQGHG